MQEFIAVLFVDVLKPEPERGYIGHFFYFVVNILIIISMTSNEHKLLHFVTSKQLNVFLHFI